MKWIKAKDKMPLSSWVGPTRFKGNIRAWEYVGDSWERSRIIAELKTKYSITRK
jgi:hypothetical protein